MINIHILSVFLWALAFTPAVQVAQLLPRYLREGTCIAASVPTLDETLVHSDRSTLPPRGAGVRKIQRVHRPVALRRGKQVGLGNPAFLHGAASSMSNAEATGMTEKGFRPAVLAVVRRYVESPVLSFAVVLMLDLAFFLSVLSLFGRPNTPSFRLLGPHHRGRCPRMSRA